ncbi:MAG: hypothetical protein KA715_05150 [Xanthomonadaceae bacterium]|nr:hypothetical protein [Xanthomonadaceae bacterium]
MEIKNDWKAFRQLWSFNQTALVPVDEQAIYCVIDGEWIIDASTRNQSLSEWVGSPVSEFAREFSNRKLFIIHLSDLNAFTNQGWIQSRFESESFESTSGAGLLKNASMRKNKKAPTGIDLGFRSFLDGLFAGRLKRFLPVEFGMFIQLTRDDAPHGFFVSFKNKELDFCVAPSFPPTVDDKVRFLSEKHLIPVIGIECHSLDWKKWNMAENPWSEIRQSFKDGGIRVSHGKKWVSRVLFAKAVLGF